MLPTPADPCLLDQLLGTAEKNAAVTLHRCHQGLELDGRAHDYTADEWLPTVYDIAAPHLEAARQTREPPSLVEQAQEAVSWLSRAIVDLDQDAPDATAAIMDSLGRILALYVFADVARNATGERDEWLRLPRAPTTYPRTADRRPSPASHHAVPRSSPTRSRSITTRDALAQRARAHNRGDR